MNKRFIWISIKTNDYNKLITRIYNCRIDYYDLMIKRNNVELKIKYDDYDKLKKYLISYKISKINDIGLYKIISIIKSNIIIFAALIISLLYFLVINNLVIKIEIANNDKKIVNIVHESLDKYNLKVLKFKKSHKEVEEIVKRIIEDNKEYIEWLEIKYDGLKMIVEVTEKVKEQQRVDEGICNIVSKRDAKILSYKLKRGEPLFHLNQYVYKDEVLVTGIIKHNEEIKSKVCASAIIYGELWYRVNVEIPFKYKEYLKTGKHQYNIEIIDKDKRYKILKSKYNKIMKTEEVLYSLNDFKIVLTNEFERKLKTVKLTEKEAYNKGIKLVIDKIKLKLDDDESIIEKKVLKKTVNNSTMNIDIFIVTKEKINKSVSAKEVELDDINGGDKGIQ